MNWISGGFCGGVTPGSMPNPAVKPSSADGTAEAIRGRVGHCRKSLLNKQTRGRSPKGTPSCCICPSLTLMTLPLGCEGGIPEQPEEGGCAHPVRRISKRWFLLLRLDYVHNSDGRL